MVRLFIVAAIALAVSCNAAGAQYTGPVPNSGIDDGGINWFSLGGLGGNYYSPTDQAREQEIERKYQETLRKIPDRKPSNDPWRSVRSAPEYDRHRPN